MLGFISIDDHSDGANVCNVAFFVQAPARDSEKSPKRIVLEYCRNHDMPNAEVV